MQFNWRLLKLHKKDQHLLQTKFPGWGVWKHLKGAILICHGKLPRV